MSAFLSIFNIGEEGIGIACNMLMFNLISCIIQLSESCKNEQKPNFPRLRFSAENHNKIQTGEDYEQYT